ncbi:MAG: sigma-54-dependent Fis family transcriptional regulator, partial [Candidatus Eremiobacteraeota bacterium]|nr:sigma-54-dependent Fis family transcriptional regulator [Candidatus Eremiobacteraeota bacterium]
MAEAEQDRFELLYRIGQEINSTLELESVFGRVMDQVITYTGAERGFLLMLDEAGDEDELGLHCKAARNLEKQTIESEEFKVSRSVVREVLKGHEPQLTIDAGSDDRFA